MTHSLGNIDNRNAINRSDYHTSSGDLRRSKIKRLKIIAITLLIIGLLLSIAGIVISIAISNPLPSLIMIPGSILTVSGIALLNRVKVLKNNAFRKKMRTLELTEETTGSLDPVFKPEPYFASENTREMLHQVFTNIQSETLQNESGEVTRRVFTNNKGLCVAFVKGDIDKPLYNPFQSRVRTAVVNSASPKLEPGGTGTNKALSAITATNTWNNCKELFQKKGKLKPGHFVRVNWVPSEIYKQEHSKSHPWNFLYQFIGPRASYYKSDPGKAYSILKVGFTNLFRHCLDDSFGPRIKILQMPLISSGTAAPTNHRRNEWMRAVAAALVDALEVIAPQTYADNPFCVVVVDSNRMPCYEATSP